MKGKWKKKEKKTRGDKVKEKKKTLSTDLVNKV